MALLELSAGDYALTIAPGIGGSLRSFSWRGEPLMRDATGPSVLDAACFPLVPFSNRIAHGRFDWDGRTVQLLPNFPGSDHPHPLHGFGWVSSWEVLKQDTCSAEIEHRYSGGEWPWPFAARQVLQLSEKGLALSLSVTNLSDQTMPAGLGFHPYFPRNERTVLHALHRGEILNGTDGIPLDLVEAAEPLDWWNGKPVAARIVDTVYTRRHGPIRIDWPDRHISLQIESDGPVDFTAIYVPEGQDWFCVEPVSHMSNGPARGSRWGGMHALKPGEELRAELFFAVA